MKRPDYFHNSTQTNINLLFNMIQACRTELTIMRGREEYRGTNDTEIIQVAEALSKEIYTVFNSNILTVKSRTKSERAKELLQYLTTHNKNYTKSQYFSLLELEEIINELTE